MAGFVTWGWGMVHRPLLLRGPVKIGTLFKDYVMEMRISGMVTKKANGYGGYGSKF